MFRRHLPILLAACASLAAHLLLWRGSTRVTIDPAIVMPDDRSRRREATFTIVLGGAEDAAPPAAEEPEATPALPDDPPEPDVPVPPVPPPPPKPELIIPPPMLGEAKGTGTGSHRAEGEREMHAREGENDQAPLSRDGRGMGRVGDAPSTAVRLPGQGGSGPAAMPLPAPPPPVERRPAEAAARNDATSVEAVVPPVNPKPTPDARDPSPRPPVPAAIFSPSALKPTMPKPSAAQDVPLAGPVRITPDPKPPADVAPARLSEPTLRLPRRGVDAPAAAGAADLPRTVRAASPPANVPERAMVAIAPASPAAMPAARDLSQPSFPLAVAPPVLPAAPTPTPQARPTEVFEPPAPAAPPAPTPSPAPPVPPAPPERAEPPKLMTNVAGANGDGRLPGSNRPAADPFQQSHSESDPFSKLGSAKFIDGRLVARFGREVKTVRPRLPIVGQVDAFAAGGASVTLKVNVDATGKVTTVAVHKSSGSNEIDQPCLVAMYEWWFEPPKDANGKPVADTLLFTIDFR